MRYRVTTTIGHRVGALNPTKRDPNSDEWQGFQKALQLVRNEFKAKVHMYAGDWREAFLIVKHAVETRFEVDPSGEILELSHGGCGWKDHLAKLESELGIEEPIKFVIFPDNKGAWKVRAVPVAPTSFILRTPLLREWQGLRDKELEEVSGIPTCIFVHANGFMGGASECRSVIQMARVSLGI